MTFDARRGVAVTLLPRHAGRGVWEWDGSAWSQRSFTGAAVADSAALAYDTMRRTTVAMSGPPAPNACWEWDGFTWRNIPLPPSGVTTHAALAYDAARATVYAFGGVVSPSGYPVQSFGAWSGGSWVTVSQFGQVPPARASHALAYDAARQRLVLFGGHDGLFPLGDTWEWDGTSWTERTPPVAPPARYGHALAYDSDRRRVLLFGGLNATELDDVWEWDGATWFHVPAAKGPAPRYGHGLVYDSLRKRMVTFGGFSGFTPVNDTWELQDGAAASFYTFGQGCNGSVGIPALAAAPGQVPRVGGNFVVNLTRLPPGASTFVYLGLSNTQWGTFPLPFDLRIIGMPGCTAYTSGNLIYSVPNLTGTASWTMSLGNAPGLLGLRFYLQGLVVDPPANTLGASVSNAGEGMIGN